MRARLAPAPGSVIGGFRLDRWLGGGEDTDVWRADGDGIVVALKLLRDPADAFARARMAREAAALRRIRDDHVVTLFAVGEEDGEPYLATPLFDAGTLAMLLDEGRLDVATAAAVLAPIASALATAHAAGVVHRDVKPSNVMLTGDGPVLLDFGAAALDGVTLDGWIDGAAARVATTAYAAPELEVRAALDVWSLGIMLLEALTGRLDVGAAADVAADAARVLIEECCATVAAQRPTALEVGERLRRLADGATAPAVAAPIVLDDRPPTRAGAVADDEALSAAHTGRELEIAQLLDMIDAAEAARELRAILVTAPPGMGKSWLLETAAGRAASRGAIVLRSTCTDSVNDLRVLAPWVRRVGDHAHLVGLLGEHHADVVVHVTGVESGGSVEADPATIADAFAALVAAADRPVAIVDDLHHAAGDLVELLGRLAFRAGVAGALWLGARPGVIDGDDLDVRTLALGPLPDEVIVDLAGAEAVELAGGNPLLARELALAHAQAQAPELAHVQAPSPTASLVTADTDVRVLIGQRIARLRPVAAADLDLAATCGEVFWPETLGVTRSLGVLCRSGLVRLRPDSAIPGSTEAEWTHPLLREVAYDDLAAGTRRDAHAAVAHRLDAADTEPEAIAHHAAAAFELGAADESEFVGDVSARAARVALDRFALANAERWTTLVRRTGHEPAPGTADTLEAELLLRRGEFERSGTLADRWTERSDEVGTHALAVSAEAHLATGEYDTAEHAAAAALARIPDSRWRDQLTSTYVELLKRRGNYEQAATLAEQAARGARARADNAMAARLEVKVALNRLYLANTLGEGVVPHIEAVERAAYELEQLGDRRAFVESAGETATALLAVDSASALELLTRAIAVARALEAWPRMGALAALAAETALELDRPTDALSWMAAAEDCPLEQHEAEYLTALRLATNVALDRDTERNLAELDALSRRPDAGISAQLIGAATNLWLGRVDGFVPSAIEGPHVAHAVARLAMRAISGPPWLPIEAFPPGAENDAALSLYLAGDNEGADELLRKRFRYLKASGRPYERYNVIYPGPLVMALGPPDVLPRIEWLIDRIVRPQYVNLWAVHRSLCALILAERGIEGARGIASAGLSIVRRIDIPGEVAQWLVPRLEAASQ